MSHTKSFFFFWWLCACVRVCVCVGGGGGRVHQDTQQGFNVFDDTVDVAGAI